jgi:hypothetical protein
MKHTATMALMLNLGVAGVYAHEKPVRMRFSGTSATSATDLQQPGTSNDEDNFAGDGTLGQFTLRNVRAVATSSDPSGTCPSPTQLYFPEPYGAGVFRSQARESIEGQCYAGERLHRFRSSARRVRHRPGSAISPCDEVTDGIV